MVNVEQKIVVSGLRANDMAQRLRDAKIAEDKIVVKKQNYANNTDIVVAMLNGSATVKRFYKENGQIRLQPENDFMKPIYCVDVDILGKVVGLIRNY